MNTNPLTHLGSLSVEEFLRDYWQKKPLLIRQAFPNYEAPLSADELAGLALEEEAEARIIIEQGNGPWEMRSGPFQEADFNNLPKDKWTLLVQAVDHWVPEVSELLERFKFIPSWRLDDIMISYAVDGGSVGPHFDQYDVFLLQGRGKRRWKTGQLCSQSSPILEDTPLHILKDFECDQEWLLEPGDMIYIPPQVAHWGTAEGDDCMTLSVGFRAPSHAEIIADFVQEQLSHLDEDHRYNDGDLIPQENPGEIDSDAIDQIRKILLSQLDQPEKISQWFGSYMTKPKYDWPEDVENTFSSLDDLNDEDSVYKNPAARLAYSNLVGRQQSNDECVDLYANGEVLNCSTELTKLLCSKSSYQVSELRQAATPQDSSVINQLISSGILVSDENDFDEED